jgi:hypothetical protein
MPLTASLLHYKRMRARYLPLVVLFALGFANELTSVIMVYTRRNNSINSNLYTLMEFLLFLLLFRQLGVTTRKFLLAATAGGIVCWIADILTVNGMQHHIVVSRILSSLIIVWLSMERIVQLIYNNPEQTHRRTDLAFCSCFFVYYAYQAFIAIFDLFPMGMANGFYTSLWLILGIINLVMNIVYTTVILWIPKPRAFTLRSSLQWHL